MSTLIDKIPENFVVNKRGSKKTGRYGLYIEAVAYVEASGWMAREVRVFVTDTMVCMYRRKRGRKAGRWTSDVLGDEKNADGPGLSKTLRAKAIDKIHALEVLGYAVALRGDPLLVELGPDDVASEDMPTIRYSLEAYGVEAWGPRVSDEDWTPSDVAALQLDYSPADSEAQDEAGAGVEADGAPEPWIEKF